MIQLHHQELLDRQLEGVVSYRLRRVSVNIESKYLARHKFRPLRVVEAEPGKVREGGDGRLVIGEEGVGLFCLAGDSGCGSGSAGSAGSASIVAIFFGEDMDSVCLRVAWIRLQKGNEGQPLDWWCGVGRWVGKDGARSVLRVLCLAFSLFS